MFCLLPAPTFAQDALPDHARCSEEDHFHLTVSLFLTKACTRASAPTIDRMKGTGSQSIDGGMLGKRLPYRTCSTLARRTICLVCDATSRSAGSGCTDRRAQALTFLKLAIQNN